MRISFSSTHHPMKIDFLGLHAFVAIADCGSFQLAAAQLNLSQTALSHRIRRLEDDLGVTLLLRTTRTVSLSPAGHELLPKVRAMIGDLSSALDETRRVGTVREQKLVIGCLPTIAAACLGGPLKQFRKIHPDVTVHVQDTSANELAERLNSGSIEFAVTITTPLQWNFQLQSLRKDPLMLVCRKQEFAGRSSANWSDLRNASLIRIGPHTANRMDEALGGRRESLTWRYEVQHVKTAIAFVRAGLGMTVAPKLALESEDIRGLSALPLRNPSVARQIGIATRKQVPLSPVADQLRKLIVKEISRRDL
jgi:DNA-binding transcriptional LysR family regulator